MTRKRNKDKEKGRQKRRISDMIWEFAGDFIRMAETPEQRQSQLNAACSAWNIACNPPVRRKTTDQYMREYGRLAEATSVEQFIGIVLKGELSGEQAGNFIRKNPKSPEDTALAIAPAGAISPKTRFIRENHSCAPGWRA